jgi:PA14 domain
MSRASTSHLRALFLLGVLGCASAGCVDAEDEVAFTPSGDGRGVVTAGASCGGAEPPEGVLRGYVYSLPLETRTLPDFRAMRPAGAVCTDALAVTERRGYPGFPGLRHPVEWFGVDFQGTFVVASPGLFHFRLTSDDGSQLYIDGALVIDNDGFHATRAAQGDVYLDAGPHGITVPYWQGPGPFALILEVARPGDGYQVFHVDRPLEGGGP